MHQIKLSRLKPFSFIGFRMLLGRPAEAREKGVHKARHGIFLGAILGIGISIVPLYIVIFVSNGMIKGITERYLETKTSHLQMSIPFDLSEENRSQRIETISALPGVVFASLEIDGLGLAASAKSSTSAQIRGLEESITLDKGYRQFIEVDVGEPFPQKENEVVLGRYLAKALGVGLGETVSLMTLRETEGAEILPKLSIFRVAGIVSSGYRELDANWFIIHFRVAQRLLNSDMAYAYIGIKTKDPYGPDLDKIMNNIKNLYPEALVRPWRDIEQGLFKSFSSTRSLLIFIMAIASIVAAVNLSSVLTTFVIEHRTEIAVLRSFGISRKQTMLIFLLGGTATGIIGCILGSAVGIAISLCINHIILAIQTLINFFTRLLNPSSYVITLLNPDYYLERIPISMNWSYIILILCVGVLVSAIVSLIPAFRSSSIAPAELIRHE